MIPIVLDLTIVNLSECLQDPIKLELFLLYHPPGVLSTSGVVFQKKSLLSAEIEPTLIYKCTQQPRLGVTAPF
jgi:hypothetical protein